MMYIPNEIKKYVLNYKFIKNNVGRSGDDVYIFEKAYVLKISKDIQKLFQEMTKIDWLEDKIDGLKSICFITENDKAYYLRNYLNGDTLIDERFLMNPKLLINTLKEVKTKLRQLDKYNCPFKSSYYYGDSFIHGDLCLPNIVVDKDNHFIGFVDLEDCGLGDEWYDYAWLIWSFEYNLKTTEFTDELLETLNIKMDKDKYNRYISN